MINEQRVADCRRLYEAGHKHHEIERRMRALGHSRFRRRVLYRRNERGRSVPGWIERFEWGRKVRSAECGVRNRGLQRGTFRRVPFMLPKMNRQKQRRLKRQAERASMAQRREMTKPIVPAIPHSAFRTPHLNGVSPFHDWLISVSPYMKWDAAHHRHIIETLERVTSGKCKRLMIFMPPRHGKSELVTVRYAAWRMKQKPETNIIIGSYNQRLANRFSRKIKMVLCDDFAIEQKASKSGGKPLFQTLEHENVESKPANSRHLEVRKVGLPPPKVPDHSSPFPFARPRFKNSESEWETRFGGGLRAVGVGSGVTGFGANLLIVDDPVKSRAEANSIKYRERVYDWFNDDLYTRLEPDGQIILIQTRWHEDDLAGRLLAEENGDEWTVIDLPALAEVRRDAGEQVDANEGGGKPAFQTLEHADGESTSVNADRLEVGKAGLPPLVDILNRRQGDALWPERFTTENLENTKGKIGNYSFASLYQQHPVPAEGGMFKKEWFTHILDRPPAGLIWKRGYDLGITANPTSDYTASYRVAYDRDGNLWIDGGFRARIEYPEQRRYVLGRIRDELDTEHGIEETANGSAVVQDLRKEVRLQGRAFKGVKVKGDKAARAATWINIAAEGKLRLVRAAWNKEFIDECCAFPLGTHDDQVDAVSIAVAMHTRKRYALYAF